MTTPSSPPPVQPPRRRRRARPPRGSSAIIWCAAIAAGVAACAHHRPVAPAPTLDSTGVPVVAADVFPSRAVERFYASTDGEGVSIRRSIAPSGAAGIDILGREFPPTDPDASGAPREERLLHLRREADGSVVLLSAVESDQTTFFDPPLVYMPVSLRPGQSFEATTAVRVIDSRGREKGHGTASRRLQHRGTTSLGAGPVPTAQTSLLEGVLEISMPPARATTETTLWVTGDGILRELQQTTVRVLGVVVERRTHDVLRASSE